MVPPLVAAGIVSGLGSLLGGVLANKGAAKEAQKNREFQERMSSTAYQRAVADMRLGGINPMLAYMQGGASSPSGNVADVHDVVGPAVSSAQAGGRLAKEMKMMDGQLRSIESALLTDIQTRANIFTDTEKKGLEHAEVEARTRLSDAATLETMSRIPMHETSAKHLQTEIEKLLLEMPELRNKAAIAKSGVGKVLSGVERARQAIFGGSGIIVPVGRSAPTRAPRPLTKIPPKFDNTYRGPMKGKALEEWQRKNR